MEDFEEKDPKFQEFLEEIRALAEDPDKQDFKDAFGLHFDINELGQADMEIWQKIKDKSVTAKDMEQYRNEILEIPKESPSGQTRRMFLAYAGNLAMGVIGLRPKK